MKSISIKSIVELIARDTFVLQEDWERNWSAQPLSGRRYFVGNPRQQSACKHAIQWSPRKRSLSIWRVGAGSGEQSLTKRVAASTARRITRLIVAKLSSQARQPVEKTGCTCRHQCC